MMSPTISLPTWMLIACVALWALTVLLWIVFRMARKRALRSRNEEPQMSTDFWPNPTGFNTHIQQEMLSQQIDTVFRALSSLIEAERIKLHTLIGPGGYQGAYPAVRHHDAVETASMSKPPEPENHHVPERRSYASELGSTIAELSQQGLEQEDIARRLGLSRNEIRLASKMVSHNNRERESRRLNAVA